ncbi:MAG: porin family protein [Candidatus Krumholzibacteria bacterium]|nr:porin family protein [Candidatus Krumholzibacteria bacterium]MDH4338601.1 porin family protein [Candidatus Krumholzibacteria bacterium]MDH5271254.1 porin family protein [Candidatus Krumholzibacteria bacterium]
MTRKMPLWGVVLSLALGWGSLAYGQQQTPVSAANDSLTTTGEEVAPTTGGAGPTEMTADTTGTIRRVRRADDRLMYYMSMGVGSSINYLPESFKDSYDPAFGIRIGGGVTRYNLRLGISISYNFFFSNGPTTLYPDDLNILTVFGELKYVPVGKTIRPYLLACGGYYRQWIVNTEYTENVLGYGGGAGIELVIDKVRHLYIEGRYVQGQTRETEQQANTESIPMALGVVWVF